MPPRKLKIISLEGKVLAQVKSTGAIKIGFGQVGVIDRKYCRPIWENKGTIFFSGKAYFGPGTRIICKGYLKFGNNVTITGDSDIICFKNVSIGNDVLISWKTTILDTDFHPIINKINDNRINNDKDLYIGNHVWIGCNTTILKGSYIANDTVIGACSLINSRLEQENSIYRDNKIIRNNINWLHR